MTFKNWQKKYPVNTLTFKEIKIPNTLNPSSSQITLRIPGKFEVSFPHSIMPDYLVQIISQLNHLSGH
jgi:hypothetical protein